MSEQEYGRLNGQPPVPEPETASEINTHYGTPETADCSSDAIPKGTQPDAEKKKILVPDLVSMWKYMLAKGMGNQRLALYSYLNRALRSGELSKVVGFRVKNRTINRAACELKGVDFWKIDRESFYANVRVHLTLQSVEGDQTWDGYLCCCCTFTNLDFSCIVEELTDTPWQDEEEFDRLNPYLVPYYTNKRVEEIAEQLWVRYGMPEALTDPKKRDAVELARRMGLTIISQPIYGHQGVNSILFFAEGEIKTGEDRIERHKDGTRKHIKTEKPETITIPANTIVINTNRITCDYSRFNVLHECVHYELHYMFFRLQQMCSNDVRQIRTIEIEPEEGKRYSDPVYFMEKQADRGAYALLMPAGHTRKTIFEESSQIRECKNEGDRYQTIGLHIADELNLPHFRVRARMIQLGFIEAKGALNYVERELIQPFAFDPDAWRESEISYVIDPQTVKRLRQDNDDFARVMASGDYVYADGHIVRNTARYVMQWGDSYVLTDEALGRVNDCCLRFVRRYVQTIIGRYEYDRMFYDPHYVEQTAFYLDDLVNGAKMDELDARMAYRESFPRTFVKAFDMLMKKNGETRESIAPKLHTTERSLHDWLYDPEHKITLDFVVGVSLMWELPDWISKLLLDRAMIRVSEYDRRHQAMEYIRTVLWDKGIEEANKYLEEKGLSPLAI